MTAEKAPRWVAADGEIYVLRDVADNIGDLERIDFRYHHADHRAAAVE
jgi:hypothetical protein